MVEKRAWPCSSLLTPVGAPIGGHDGAPYNVGLQQLFDVGEVAEPVGADDGLGFGEHPVRSTEPLSEGTRLLAEERDAHADGLTGLGIGETLNPFEARLRAPEPGARQGGCAILRRAEVIREGQRVGCSRRDRGEVRVQSLEKRSSSGHEIPTAGWPKWVRP